MAVDVGSIIARLLLDRTQFDRSLAEAVAEAKAFGDITVPVRADTSRFDASMVAATALKSKMAQPVSTPVTMDSGRFQAGAAAVEAEKAALATPVVIPVEIDADKLTLFSRLVNAGQAAQDVAAFLGFNRQELGAAMAALADQAVADQHSALEATGEAAAARMIAGWMAGMQRALGPGSLLQAGAYRALGVGAGDSTRGPIPMGPSQPNWAYGATYALGPGDRSGGNLPVLYGEPGSQADHTFIDAASAEVASRVLGDERGFFSRLGAGISGGAAALLGAAGAAGGAGGGLLGKLLWGGGSGGVWGVGAGLAGLGSLGSFAGLGPEHLIMTLAGLGGSAAGALGGGALLAAGNLGTAAVGLGTDMAGIGQAAGDIRQYGQLTGNLQQAQAVYGKGSVEYQAAMYAYQQWAQDLSATTIKALQTASNTANQFHAMFDSATADAETTGANIITQAMHVGEKFLPTIGKYAAQNMNIIQADLQPFMQWLGTDGLGYFTDLENIFQQHLPTDIGVATGAFEFLLRTVDTAAGYTGGFMTKLDAFFQKWNQPANFAVWATEIGKLIGDFHLWEGFIDAVGRALKDLFENDAGTGNTIITTLTTMLDKLAAWESSTSGKSQLHNIFETHLQEVQQLLQLLPPLVEDLGKIELTTAPALTRAFTDVLKVLQPLINLLASNPFTGFVLGATLIAAKLGVLSPLIGGITGAVRGLAGAFSDIRNFSAISLGLEDASGPIGRLAQSMGGIAEDASTAALGVSAMAKDAESAAGDVEGVASKVGGLGEEAGTTAKGVSIATDAMGVGFLGLLGPIGIATAGIAGIGIAFDMIGSKESSAKQADSAAAQEFVDSFLQTAGAAGDTTTQIEALINTEKQHIATQEYMTGSTFQQTDEINDLNNVLNTLTHSTAGATTASQLMAAAQHTLSGATSAQQAALEKQTSSIVSTISAMQQQGDTSQQITARVGTLTGQLVGNAKQYGVTTTQVENYLHQLGLTPAQVKTELLLDGYQTAMASIADLAAAINNLPSGKTINVNVAESYGQATGTGSGVSGGNAIIRYSNNATGAVLSGFRTHEAAIVGEDGSGYDEYVIPTNPAHRSNAMALTGALLGDLGMMAGGGVLANQPTVDKTINVDFTTSGAGGNNLTGFLAMAEQQAGAAAAQQMQRQLAALGTAGGGGAIQQLAMIMAAQRGWTGAQWAALNAVEMDEAGWNMHAQNPTSDAYGLAQGITGPSWYYGYGGNPYTAQGQLTAMFNYIGGRYGSPLGALAHENAYHWYATGGILNRDSGGPLPPGVSTVYNGTGSDEYVLPPDLVSALQSLISSGAGSSAPAMAANQGLVLAVEGLASAATDAQQAVLALGQSITSSLGATLRTAIAGTSTAAAGNTGIAGSTSTTGTSTTGTAGTTTPTDPRVIEGYLQTAIADAGMISSNDQAGRAGGPSALQQLLRGLVAQIPAGVGVDGSILAALAGLGVSAGGTNVGPGNAAGNTLASQQAQYAATLMEQALGQYETANPSSPGYPASGTQPPINVTQTVSITVNAGANAAEIAAAAQQAVAKTVTQLTSAIASVS